MALSSTTNRQSYSPSSATTVYSYPYPYFDTADIKVSVSGYDSSGNVDADSTIDLVYNASPSAANEFKVTATNNDPAQGATITTVTGYASGTVTIRREVAYTQQYDLQEGASIDPTALNKALDRVVAQNQQQNDEFTRSVVHPATDPTTTTYNVGNVTDRAGRALGYDSDGNITTLNLVTSGTVTGDSSAGINISANQISGKADNSSIEFDSNGNFSVKDDGITNAMIADDAVNSAQLNTDAVTTAKITDHQVTYAKMQEITTNLRALGRTSSGVADVAEVPIDTDLTSITDAHTELATAKAIKDYIDVYAKPNIAFAELLTKQEINSGSAVTAGNFYDVPSLEAAITTVKASSTFKVDLKLSFGSNLFNYETVAKIKYKVGSGSYQEFQMPTGYGSRTPSHFQHSSFDSDARMNVLGGSIYLSGASYSVGDVITFKVSLAAIRSASGLILTVNSSEDDTNSSQYSRGTSTLIVQEF